MTVLDSTTDPDGRLVELTAERWEHIVEAGDGHPELEPYQHALLEAVRAPNRRIPGRRSNEEWFYREGIGPSQWLKVVVAYESGRGWIVTAHGRRSFP